MVERGTLCLDGLADDINTRDVEAGLQAETDFMSLGVKEVGRRMKLSPVSEAHKNSIKMLYDRQKLQRSQVIKVSPETAELSAS